MGHSGQNLSLPHRCLRHTSARGQGLDFGKLRTISSAEGILPVCCFENTGVPFTDTSNCPGLPQRSFTFTPGCRSSSRFRLPACWRVSLQIKQRLISICMGSTGKRILLRGKDSGAALSVGSTRAYPMSTNGLQGLERQRATRAIHIHMSDHANVLWINATCQNATFCKFLANIE
jgi:hypothetical protein